MILPSPSPHSTGTDSASGYCQCIPDCREQKAVVWHAESMHRVSILRNFAQNEYSDRVLMGGWDVKREADPKDNDPYRPPGGNYFLSTYTRMGDVESSLPHSETHAMLQQIYTRGPTWGVIPYHTSSEPIRMYDIDHRAAVLHTHAVRRPTVKYCTTMQRDYQPVLLPLTPRKSKRRFCKSHLHDNLSLCRSGCHTYYVDHQHLQPHQLQRCCSSLYPTAYCMLQRNVLATL